MIGDQINLAAPLGIVLGIAVITTVILLERARFKKTTYNGLIDRVSEHQGALRTRRRQLVYADPYGNQITTKWDKEKLYFWQRNVLPHLSVREHKFVRRYNPSQFIEVCLDALSRGKTEIESFESGSPIDFENYCARVLQRAGWEASTTQACGDQGADVVASKNGTKIILQCKLYSRPVGNKAVQEAISARIFHSANFAAVVTNNDYTPSARALASTSDLELLHHGDLDRWAAKISDSSGNL